MNGHGKSDRLVVPANPPNKAAAAEAGEERRRAKGNTAGKPRPGPSAGTDASSALSSRCSTPSTRWTSGALSPQGASISPLLANVYLHHVLDLWVEWWRRRHAHGDVIIVRWADDFVVGFEHEQDARQFLDELR